eukprot:353520-Chlamydomonas_euryale.AAC.5
MQPIRACDPSERATLQSVQSFRACDPLERATRSPRIAVDPGLGLVNDDLCNDCNDLAAEDVEAVASENASVKSKERECYRRRLAAAYTAEATDVCRYLAV